MGKTERKPTYVIKAEWLGDLDLLTMTERGQLLTIVLEYMRDGETRTEAGIGVQIVFNNWRRYIDANAERWAETCKKRAEAGKASGAARREKAAIKQNQENSESVQQDEQTEQMRTKGTNVHFVEQNEQERTKRTDNDNEYDYDYDYDYDSLDTTATPIRSSSSIMKERAGARDPAATVGYSKELSDIIKYYQRVISPDISRPVVEELKRAAADFPVDVVFAAIDSAIDSGKRNGSYVCGVLRGYRKDGVKTLQDVQRNQEKFRADREAERAARQARSERNRPAGSSGALPYDGIAYMFQEFDDKAE